jgi:hypothetical protein
MEVEWMGSTQWITNEMDLFEIILTWLCQFQIYFGTTAKYS